ncbi:PRC-barrel domain-containing protein [Pontibacter sp. H249]|uniref:PRC-barrel domain-containing protein n=1 Tax=Pontibacter sp. H249 TaxID=3133420 RepID=UPI0030C5BAC7
MATNETRNDRLSALSDLKDYKIAKDNPDVIGWRVVGADGESLGVVKDLIVDMNAMKARYLSVVADRSFFNTDRDQYMLVPIGAAALDKKGKNVFVSSIDSRSIGHYPIYQGGPVPEDYEYAVRDNFRKTQHETLADSREDDNENYKREFDDALNREPDHRREISNDFYNDEAYNEDRFYTSEHEVRDQRYAMRDEDKANYDTYSTDDLHREENQPKTVEDSIATIERLESLRKRGSITEEEFTILKRRALDI